MALRPLDLMEPEETIGNLWHDYASQVGAQPVFPDAAITLKDCRYSLVLLFRALGGQAQVEIGEAPAIASNHRLSTTRKMGTAREMVAIPRFDGERLGLPPVMQVFPTEGLNRAAYLWLTALAATSPEIPDAQTPIARDHAHIATMATASRRVREMCPGLRGVHKQLCQFILANRPKHRLPQHEAAIETILRIALGAAEPAASNKVDLDATPRGYCTFAPVPIWLSMVPLISVDKDLLEEEAENSGPQPLAASTTRKLASRENRDEANRKDSLIIHRFESILSWVESMNLNRSVDNDENDDAQKAADDQEKIVLSRHDHKKAATRLRLHLDLSPADADHERLSGVYTYPEWNQRQRSYMADHTRVLEAEADTDNANAFVPDPRKLRAVRRQFEALFPKRIKRPRQIEGPELDLDALVTAQVELRATGYASDRIYQSLRQIERDLSVAFLLDTSRSTEATIGETSVIDVARTGLAALAGGIDACGDRLGIWGFSSLRRDRVFIKRCKSFDNPMDEDVIRRICGLTPSHYTRLGAAIRHVSGLLAEEQSARRLLLVLTDGKPNDLDHYEGIHGIEDSHMAVREARRLGQTVHGIVVDEDGQDWFPRIFGRSGFTLLPNPDRLVDALPEIYRSLTQDT